MDDRTRWNERYSDVDPSPKLHPPSALLELADHIPTAGRAVDLAGGTGDAAIWLARRGLRTTLVDVSDMALRIAAERSAALDVRIDTAHIDLVTSAVPDGPWDLICCFHYLDRRMLTNALDRLSPSGVLIAGIATTTNLERHDRPSARFLLDPGELPQLLSAGSVVDYREDWTSDGRHEARIAVHRRFAAGASAE